MATLSNDELNKLQSKRHALMRELDRKEISQKEYETQVKPIEDKIKQMVRELLDKNDEQIRKEKTLEEEKMAEEKKETTKKDKPESYTQLIIKALGMKTIKSVEEAVEKVDEWRPGRDKKKIQTQMKTIIYLVKNQKGERWEKYSWDDSQFLLTEKN